MLAGRVIFEAEAEAWMDWKNNLYVASLAHLTPADLLPGVESLLLEVRACGIKTAIVSTSRNAPFVLERLGVRALFDTVVAGPEPDAPAGLNRPKPAPDLFLLAADRLGIEPDYCLVVEDAEAGVAGAKAAGMVAVGLGPVERVGAADMVLPNLSGVRAEQLLAAATWSVAQGKFIASAQGRWESVFVVGNGYLGTRGSFEERYPGDQPTTMIHGLWDDVPVVYTELANGFDWTSLDIWIDGQPLRLDQGEMRQFSRRLDLRTGELVRRLYWRPAGGALVEFTFRRLASLADPHACAQQIEITPLERAVTVRLRARLAGFVENDGILHWDVLEQGYAGTVAHLTGLTRHTRKRLSEAMTLRDEGAGASTFTYVDSPANPTLERTVTLAPDQRWTVEKLVSIYTSRDGAEPTAMAAAGALALQDGGYAVLQAANRAVWSDFWSAGDVIIEGDDQAQLATRYSLFGLRISASAHDDRVSIGARSLSGYGYRGHSFWDTESFMLPFFSYTQPALARNLLLYRFHTLAGARKKARSNGFQGAQFAWESAETGEEVTPRWVPGPQGEELVRIWCGDIELHITADIAYALMQYWHVTGDDEFLAGPGAQILLESARFWESRVEPDRPGPGQYSISDVIGPDEYHDHVDNNAFTNGMVRWHLRTALWLLDWLHTTAPVRAAALVAELELSPARLAHWQTISDRLVLTVADNGLIEQFDGFFQRKPVNWPAWEGRTKSMQALMGIEGANAHQVLKQPDVLLLQMLLPDEHTLESVRTNWDYYCLLTDHVYGSSLGPAVHAWAACKLGMAEEAYDHFMRAALVDIADVRGNAHEGFHSASAGGVWQALVFGFGGLRVAGDGFTVSPHLPSHWRRLAFGFTLRGERHFVDLRSPNESPAFSVKSGSAAPG